MKKLIYSLFTLLLYNATSLIAQVLPAQLHIINNSDSEIELRGVTADNASTIASCGTSPLMFDASLNLVSPGASLLLDPASANQISSPRHYVASVSLTDDRSGFDFCSGAVVGSPFIFQSGASWHVATLTELSSASATVIIENVTNQDANN